MAALKEPAKSDSDTAKHEQFMRELALDIVKDVYDVPDILRRFGIDRATFDRLAETRAFKAMLQHASNEWDGGQNTAERVKLKSALLVEKALPDMYGSLIDTKESLAARVELLKAVGKMGGLGHAPPPGTGGNNGSVFRLEINFPTQPTKNIVLEHAALPSEVTPPHGDFGDSQDNDFNVNDELL